MIHGGKIITCFLIQFLKVTLYSVITDSDYIPCVVQYILAVYITANCLYLPLPSPLLAGIALLIKYLPLFICHDQTAALRIVRQIEQIVKRGSIVYAAYTHLRFGRFVHKDQQRLLGGGAG